MRKLIKVIAVPILCGIVIASSFFVSEFHSEGEDVVAIPRASVVEKTEEQPLLPLILVVDGKINESNVKKSQSTEADINKVLKQNGVALKDVLYADVRQDGTFYASPKNGGCFTSNLAVGGDW